MLKKLISGGDNRTSRFHTEDDVFIGLGASVVGGAIVATQKLRNTIAGRRPASPWWPLPAISAVERFLRPQMAAIEFGSGSSTLWIGSRVKSVIAREDNEKWANITQKRVAEAGLSNCDVQFRQGADYYHIDPDARFDFAVVDGSYRWKCLQALSDKMAPGGLIYFDNSDSDKDARHYPEHGLPNTHYAQKEVKTLSQRSDVRIEELHGMINGELFAGSGTLIHFLK